MSVTACLFAATLSLRADDKKKEDSKSAMSDLKAVERRSKEAAKDPRANPGKGFDTPTRNPNPIKAAPVTRQDPKEISRRESDAQRTRDKETAARHRLDDPKKAPPSPVDKLNPTGDKKVQLGIDKQLQENKAKRDKANNNK